MEIVFARPLSLFSFSLTSKCKSNLVSYELTFFEHRQENIVLCHDKQLIGAIVVILTRSNYFASSFTLYCLTVDVCYK